jgi:hypothetical protein
MPRSRLRVVVSNRRATEAGELDTRAVAFLEKFERIFSKCERKMHPYYNYERERVEIPFSVEVEYYVPEWAGGGGCGVSPF